MPQEELHISIGQIVFLRTVNTRSKDKIENQGIK